MWKNWAHPFETSHIDGTTKAEAMGITFTNNTIVRGIRTWFVFYNSPAFTRLYLRIYESQGGAAGKLIATSTNSFVPADLYTQAYAVKSCGFTFEYLTFKASTEYFLLPYATGYTGNDSTHIGWVVAFPDPEYRGGVTPTFERLFVNGYRIAIVGAEL